MRMYSQQVFVLAPGAGVEPAANRLTADRSSTELSWNVGWALAYARPYGHDYIRESHPATPVGIA